MAGIAGMGDWSSPFDTSIQKVDTTHAKNPTISKEEDQRKAAIALPALGNNLHMAQFANEGEKRALDGEMKASAVERSLDSEGIDPNANHVQQNIARLEEILRREMDNSGQNMADNELREMAERAVASMQLPPATTENALPNPDLLNNIESAAQDMRHASRATDAAVLAAPDRVQKLVSPVMERKEATHRAIEASINMARKIEMQLRDHTMATEAKIRDIELIHELEGLLRKYEEREVLDLEKHESPDEQKDFARMKVLIEFANQNGVQWNQNGWEKAHDRKRFAAGLTACVGTMTSQDKVNQIRQQQAIQALSAHMILATTLIKSMADLVKEVMRNMRNG